MKKCNYCKEELSLDSFSINKSTRDGYSNRCRTCSSKVRRSKYIKKPPGSRIKYDVNRIEKSCKVCLEILPMSSFEKSKGNADGRMNTCIICRKKKRSQNPKVIRFVKTCTRCKIKKPIKSYYKDKGRNDGYDATCSSCRKEIFKDKYRNNEEFKEDARSRSKKWREENRERVRKRDKEYYQKTKNTPRARYGMYKSAAIKRDLTWNISIDEFKIFWQKPCTYCNSEIKTIGLDRIDSSSGYSLDNVVPCCSVCNRMKMELDLDFYMSHLKKIKDNFKGADINLKTKKAEIDKHEFSRRQAKYKYNAKDRGLKWKLSVRDFKLLWKQDCTYCGDHIETIGIDRINSSGDYSWGNIVPCCHTCNKIKLNLDLDFFIKHIDSIVLNKGTITKKYGVSIENRGS